MEMMMRLLPDYEIYILIAYHMLESRSGAYLEWLSNELGVTAKT
jgi:hypothetical protein